MVVMRNAFGERDDVVQFVAIAERLPATGAGVALRNAQAVNDVFGDAARLRTLSCAAVLRIDASGVRVFGGSRSARCFGALAVRRTRLSAERLVDAQQAQRQVVVQRGRRPPWPG